MKPQLRHELYVTLRMHEYTLNAEIVLSILAGVTHEMLQSEVRLPPFPACSLFPSLQIKELFFGPIIRLTPNVPCAVGSGVTLLYGTNEEAVRSSFSFQPCVLQNEVATKLLAATGEVIFVEEKNFNAASAIAGSGPAFAFSIIDALADGGVFNGLPREASIRMAALMLRGAADLVLQGGKHPSVLKDQVCSPGGTTIAGIRELERGGTCFSLFLLLSFVLVPGVRSALIEAVTATKHRADQLGS